MEPKYMCSWPPPYKTSWWDRLFLKKGDIWEQRINEWGVWDEDFIGRWEWDGEHWIEYLGEPAS